MFCRSFFFGRCVVCSSIYGFWLLLYYLCTSYLNFLKPVFSGVHVTRSLVSYVCFVDRFSLVVVSSVLRFTDSDYYYTTCAWQSYLNFLKPVFSRVHVTRSLVLYVCFVDHCLSFCTFFYGRCVVCSSIYGFWLLLNYLCTSYLNFLKPVFSGVHVTRSLVSYVCFVDRFSLVVVSSVLRFTDSDYYYTTCARVTSTF